MRIAERGMHMVRMILLIMLAALAASPAAASAATPEQDQRFGHWLMHGSSGFARASTENAEGAVLGFMCGNSNCAYFLYPQWTCPDGQKYFAVVSSEAGGSVSRLTCRTVEGASFLMIDDDHISKMLVGRDVAFAMPIPGGKFYISHFSMDGVRQAVAATIDLAIPAPSEKASEKAPDDAPPRIIVDVPARRDRGEGSGGKPGQ